MKKNHRSVSKKAAADSDIFGRAVPLNIAKCGYITVVVIISWDYNGI